MGAEYVGDVDVDERYGEFTLFKSVAMHKKTSSPFNATLISPSTV